MFLLLGMPHTPCTHLFLLCPANTFLKPGISLDYRLPHTCVGASPWCCHYTLCSALTPLYYCLFPCSSWPYLSFLRAETVCHHHCIPHYWCSAWDVVYTQQMLKEWMSPTNQGQHTPVHSGNCSLTLSTLTLPKALFFWAVCGCWRALDNAELFLKCVSLWQSIGWCCHPHPQGTLARIASTRDGRWLCPAPPHLQPWGRSRQACADCCPLPSCLGLGHLLLVTAGGVRGVSDLCRGGSVGWAAA